MTLTELLEKHRDTIRGDVSCGDGWFSIVDKMCDEMRALDVGVVFVQIKEKFGELRAYYVHDTLEDPGDRAKLMCKLNDVTDRAEAASIKTCERCGAPGELRHSFWLKTLCDKCAQKF